MVQFLLYYYCHKPSIIFLLACPFGCFIYLSLSPLFHTSYSILFYSIELSHVFLCVVYIYLYLYLYLYTHVNRSDLLDLDELTREIMSGRVLCGFKALVPNFPPTFKVSIRLSQAIILLYAILCIQCYTLSISYAFVC